jgi:hypothetical protein
MDPGIQQFLNSDTNHNFPLVKSPPHRRTIPRNTGLNLVLLWPPAPIGAGHLWPFIPSRLAARFVARPARKGWPTYQPANQPQLLFFGLICRKELFPQLEEIAAAAEQTPTQFETVVSGAGKALRFSHCYGVGMPLAIRPWPAAGGASRGSAWARVADRSGPGDTSEVLRRAAVACTPVLDRVPGNLNRAD